MHLSYREIELRCLPKVLCVRRGLKFATHQKRDKEGFSLVGEELFL